MQLMINKGIRQGIAHPIHKYAKACNKHMKDYDKNKASSNLKYCDVKSSYAWLMSQKLPGNNFEWIKDTSQIKNLRFYK